MIKNIEVELKFQVLDNPQVESFLKKLEFIGEKRVVDIYLDSKAGDLYKKGIFIRVRNNKRLEFKVNLADFQNQEKLGKHEHCDEISFPLPLPNDSVLPINNICKMLGLKEITIPTLEALKRQNNLMDSVTIDKVRRTFTDKKFEIALDEVKNLGRFLEIEFLTSEETHLEEIKNEMREKLARLNLKLITTGYNEVYWRKYDFNLYLQGRYLFEEDYGKYRT